MLRWLFPLPAFMAFASIAVAEPPAKPTAEQVEFFEKKVRPLLADNCYSCHGAKKQSGGLRLDTAAGLKAGIDGVAVVVAGDLAKSKLIKAVKRDGELPMPPKTPLPSDAVATLTEWVKSGAAIPNDQTGATASDPRNHWAFQPIKAPAIPANGFANINPIDSLVFAKLSDK